MIPISANRNDSAVFFCRGCSKEIRIIPSGTEPENGCLTCGVVEWQRMTDEETSTFWLSQRGEKFDVARVFFCMNRDCRIPAIEWRGADISAPCSCGSRAFEELVGPGKIEWLHKHGGRTQ